MAAAGLVLAVSVSACGTTSRPPGSGAAAATALPTVLSATTTTRVDPPTTTTAPAAAAAPAAAVPHVTSTTASPPPVTGAAPVSAPPACPPGPAAALVGTGPAHQLLTVVGTGYATTVATVEAWSRQGGCWVLAGGPWTGRVGQNGFSDRHREGDGTTPTGLYGISTTFYGNAPDPGVHGTYVRLTCGDWWDEDPGSPAYNTYQVVPCGETPPFGGGSEALWTETEVYPSFAVIEYNTGPVVPWAGSGVFLHADTGTPTAGCVSLPLPDLDWVLRWLQPSEDPAVVMGPASEIGRF